MAKAWFYLTLWRGTPPEFTEEVTTEIQTATGALASIATETQAETQIKTATQIMAEIVAVENGEAEIVTRTEVIWLVGS